MTASTESAAARALRFATAAFLRERADELLRASANAGDADLWGETIRHAMIDAGLELIDEAITLEIGP